jgi:hypothetical protein
MRRNAGGISDEGFSRLASFVSAKEEDEPEKEKSEEKKPEDEDAGEDQIPGGLADDAEPEDFPLDQLLKGIKVELEHTDDPEVAMEIAQDHLEEHDRYYDALEDMEDELSGKDEEEEGEEENEEEEE